MHLLYESLVVQCEYRVPFGVMLKIQSVRILLMLINVFVLVFESFFLI